MERSENLLFFGDNLDVLRKHIRDNSVDLIYLDPPFNSKATYNILFDEKSGKKSAAQITAFEDTWHWGLESEQAFKEIVTHGPKRLADLMQAMRAFLGQNDMMAYLTMMAIRMLELHRVLKPTGSLYLHCDPTASHYIKLILDAIFGFRGYRNEIVWKRTPFSGSSKVRARQYPRSHDIILFYTKSEEYKFKMPLLPYDKSYYKRFINPDNDPRGPYQSVLLKTYSQETFEKLKAENRLIPPKRPGANWRYKLFLSDLKGRPIDDVWTDIYMINPVAKERLGYPTQKPEALLERIIQASSDEGDLVLDPFCGCGTTVVVAERLRRRWIGIDITYLAINLIKRRLHDTFRTELSPYRVIGIPVDLAGAEALAKENRHQFEWWALDLVGARPAQDKKKGPDTGIDGYIYFFDDQSGKAKKIVVQVKSGHVTVSQIRDLKGVVEREKAVIGAFITLQSPTRAMMREAATAGFYEPEHFTGRRFPRIQILTIEELLNGRQLEYPRVGVPATYKQAQRRSKGPEPEQLRGIE